jgi:hypothetical protein
MLNYHALKKYGRVEIYVHVFLTSVLDGRLTTMVRAPGTHLIGCWVDPKVVSVPFGEEKKIPSLPQLEIINQETINVSQNTLGVQNHKERVWKIFVLQFSILYCYWSVTSFGSV